MNSIRKPIALFLNGPQGAGKGTQGDIFEREFGFARIIAGDILREKARNDPDYRQLIEDCQNQGILVPDEVTVHTVITHYNTLDLSECCGIVFDGCMRTPGQTRLILEFALKQYTPVVVFLVVPEEIAIQRMLERNRPDDTLEIIKTRLDNYKLQRNAILGQVMDMMLSVCTVDSSKTIDQVFQSIYQYIAKNYHFHMTPQLVVK
jgi:adenylate kinase